ncbi:helix-turn-helix transcriptional regulator [Clostridium sporogenes]|nr:helix-turn-helix transcriptional regulator [Clostridium sporogenes]
MVICERLKKLRKTSNYSQEQLANMISVSRQAISKWESGKLNYT